MKKILALLLAVVMVFGLAACSESEGGSNTTAGSSTTVTKVTLKVSGPAEDQADGNNWLAAMEAKFAEAHPEYEITWENEVLNEGDAGGIITNDASAAADVYMFANDQLGSLIQAGAITRLGGAFEQQVKDDNSERLVSTVTYSDGNIYAFPVTNNTWFMYYNKEIFSEEDVKSLDTMLTKGKVAFNWGTAWYSGTFFLSNGGVLFGENGIDASAGMQLGGDNGGYEAAAKMVELAANPNFVNDESGAGNAGLIDGSIGAYFSGSWDYAGLYEKLGDKLGAVQLPMVEIGGKQVQMKSFAGSKCVGVNPHADNALAATQFAAFLASVESQQARYEMRGVIPAAKALAETDAIKSNMIAVAEINTMNNASVAQPTIPEMGDFWTPVGNFAALVVNGGVDMTNYTEQVDQMMDALNNTGL